MNLKPYSSSILAFGGFLLVTMGVYFVFIRPPLLPEDLSYMKIRLAVIDISPTGLSAWLQKVFWVMGGYIFTSGLLTIFIAFTSFRMRMPGAFSIVLISGISSIGFMTVVNFIIDSNFKWLLLAFSLPWVIALIGYRFQK